MINLNRNDSVEFISAGLFKSEGEWCHPRRIIDTYEIIFMYEGKAYICEDGVEYTLEKNDILLLEPYREHYGFKTSTEYVSFSWLHYCTDYERYKGFVKKCNFSNASALKTLFSQCMHVVNTPGYSPLCADLYTALYIEEILVVGDEKQNFLASKIKEYVSLNSDKDLSVKSVAEHFGYHENHISRVFKSAYGIQLTKYITNQRLECARALLNTTLYTVGQTAELLSFKSENHFIKFFKYHSKITPSQYRNLYINTYINKK